MIVSRIAVVVALGMGLFGAGCLAPSVEAGDGHDGDGDATIGTAEEPVVSMNRLSLNRMSLNSLPMKALSTASLAQENGQLSATSLLHDPDGRELLTYIVRCALPDGVNLTGTRNGKTYVFEGHLGLAPDWLSAPLSLSGQRWMTACLLAHANAYGVEVPISLRGDSPALSTTADEEAGFTMEEASFYGNAFEDVNNGNGNGPQALYACAGAAVQQAESGADHFRMLRGCRPYGQCRLNVPGACIDITPAEEDACEGAIVGGYSGCHSTAEERSQGWGAQSMNYTEVITVYLNPTDFSHFYDDDDEGGHHHHHQFLQSVDVDIDLDP